MRVCHSVSIGVLGLALLARPAAAQLRACDNNVVKAADLVTLDLESLLNVKVTTASKSSESLSSAPGVMSVVSQDELRRFGGITLREVLERVPGLMPTTAYFTDRSILAARGDQTKINGGHVLMLINGRPTREVLEGGLISDLLESFPVSALERIEVIKGPGSVLYGSNAFSAVVNLITLAPEENGFTLAALPGADGALVTSGRGALRCGELSIIGAAQLHRKPEWRTSYVYPFEGDPLAPPVPTVQQIAIRDRSNGAYIGLDYRRLRFMSSFTDWQTAAFVRGTVGENRWRRGFADVGYSMTPRRNWDTSVNLTFTRNTFDIDEFPNISRDSNEIVLELTNSVKATSRDKVTFGALFNRITGEEIYYGLGFPIPISDGHRAAAAAYMQLDHRLTSDVKLIGGFQANKIEGLDLSVVPRAGVIWSPVTRVNVKALYGKAFRAPSINETSLDHPGLTGTPGLHPEKVGTFDLGVGYQGERLQAGVNYFHSKQTESITIDSTGPRWSYVNRGEATFQGIELEGKYYVSQQLLLLGSILHQVNENDTGAENVTPIPNTGAKAGVSYTVTRSLTASVFDVYQTTLTGYSVGFNPAPASYHLLKAKLQYDILKHFRTASNRGLSFVVHGDNLTNEQVWLPDWGGNTGDTIPAIRGRSAYFGIEIR
jgi:outer membrane receptor for ferrienterochelin and colicins